MKKLRLSSYNVEEVRGFTDSNHWGYVNIWSLKNHWCKSYINLKMGIFFGRGTS